MESIYLGIRVVFPLLCYMALGWGVRRLGWMSEKALAEMNRMVFRVFMSTLLFINAYSVDIENVINAENIKVFAIAVVFLAIIFGGAELFCGRFIADQQRRAVIIQGLYRSNLALFGLPISIALYGEGGLGAISILIAAIVPAYNILAAFVLGGAAEKKTAGWRTVLRAFSNPLVIGSFLGLAVNLAGITIPALLLTPVEAIAKAATPLAFLVLGGSLVFAQMRADIKAILGICAVRLVIIPIIVIGGAIALGIRAESLAALMGVFASPVAVSSYTMAKEYDVAPDLAGEFVAVTTIASLFSMFGCITILNYFHFI